MIEITFNPLEMENLRKAIDLAYDPIEISITSRTNGISQIKEVHFISDGLPLIADITDYDSW